MKLKITGKLTAYFALALTLFALVMGLMFSVMFRNYTLKLNQDSLVNRAEQMALSLSRFDRGMERGHGGINSAARLLSEAGEIDVWLLGPEGNMVSMGRMQDTGNYNQLPDGAQELIRDVFLGKTVQSRAFSSLLEQPTITVATPVLSPRGEVALALLLHSAVEGADSGVMEGLKLMAWAALIGLLLSAIASTLFARHFIRPIKQMQIEANHMAQGDFASVAKINRRDELGALSKDLNRLAISLKDWEDTGHRDELRRREFLANVSHELRTPVTVLQTSLEAIQDGLIRDEETLAAFHGAMLKETLHLKRLILDLLELSRLQSPDYRINMETLDAEELVADAARAARALGENKQLQIEMESEPGLKLQGDPVRLKQALMILLDNAVKVSPMGGEIRLQSQKTPEGLVFSVEDRGPGIPEEDLGRLFDRFFTHARADEDKGTGLGLSIAREIAARHGATLRAKNRAGGGAEFQMVFPESE